MPDQKLPVYKIVDGKLVRKEDDIQDPSRRYSQVVSGPPHGTYLREFTDDEEKQADAEKARWEAEAPLREAQEKQELAKREAFHASLKYETRLVAFIDILGWTSAVLNSHTTPESAQKLGLVLDSIRQQTQLVEWMIQHGGDQKWSGDPRATHFSDSLVISTSVDYSGRQHLISALKHLSVGLLWQGFVLRGGITVGEIYHQESIVYGPALIEAIKLEKQAHYPRIILDHTLASRWGQGDVFENPNGARPSQEKTWRLDNDGYRFLDFFQPLGHIHLTGPSELSSAKKILQTYKKNIVANLHTHGNGSDVRPKYVWLANYFNDVCREYEGDAELLITL